MNWSLLMSQPRTVTGLGIRQYALLALLMSIANHPCFGANQKSMSIEKTVFGKTLDGTEVHLYKCTNAKGASMSLTEYGAIMVSVEMPDRNGKLDNITLGFEKLEGYLQRHPYFGATVGRYANRIALGKFTLNGKEYSLATNNGPNHLHGGENGFDRQVWQAEEISTGSEVGVKFSRTSPDGEEGYPGNLDVTVIYTLNNDNEIKMVMSATTDQDTVLNLTNHNYWNLGGANSGSILEHQLMITSDKFLAVDDTLIPTGEMTPVQGTPLDFTSFHAIGERIQQIDADPVGYDHCFVLRSNGGSLQTAAKVKDAKSGRMMEVLTDQPGIQFYSGNFLDGSEGGNGHKQYDAFCLETQRFPDSPNQPDFPTTVLKPGGKFQQTTVHRFTVE
ncbi:MAG: galactose mutarotase [Planctomycetales bacterium]|nr:galactose mutarotase [Planctomycetales bacterium]